MPRCAARRCLTCAHFALAPGGEDSGGWCHHGPPTETQEVLINTKEGTRRELRPRWPPVSDHDWCGQWKDPRSP